MVLPTQAAERSDPPFPPRDLRLLRKPAVIIQLTRLSPGLALRMPLHEKKRLRHPHEGYEAMKPVIGS